MLITLRAMMAGLGAAAMLIALSILLFGAGPTAALGFAAFDAMGQPAASRALWSADADSELRFYAALWLAFGVLAVRASRDPAAPGSPTPWLALVFFLGGVGRLGSLISVGAPHPFFVTLMTLELALPPLLYLLWAGARRRRGHAGSSPRAAS